MNQELQGAIIGGAITAIFAFIGWLGARFFKSHDANKESLDLLIMNVTEIKSSLVRLHQRMSEFYELNKALSEEVREVDRRVIHIESSIEQ